MLMVALRYCEYLHVNCKNKINCFLSRLLYRLGCGLVVKQL